MKEIFKNETRYSKKEYNLFLKTHEKEFGISEDIFTILGIIFFICFIIFTFIKHVYLTCIFVVILFIAFIVYRIIQPYAVVRKEFKSKKIKNEYKNIYYFYKHSFIIKSREGKAKIYYIKINKVLENNTHFYIYLTKKNAFVISKKGFIKGTSEEFSKFIKKKALFKYKDRSNK